MARAQLLSCLFLLQLATGILPCQECASLLPRSVYSIVIEDLLTWLAVLGGCFSPLRSRLRFCCDVRSADALARGASRLLSTHAGLRAIVDMAGPIPPQKLIRDV